MKLALRATEGV